MLRSKQKIQNTYLLSIGVAIKNLRIEAGYSSYESFANEHNLDRKQYWRLESGTNITIKTLYNLLLIHNLSAVEFFKLVEKQK